MTPKVTIKMIADHTGTSIGTVDRALSNRPGINPKTKERILRAAQEMGYSPNKAASALGRKKRIRIAAIYPSEPRFFYSHVEHGVARAREELADYGVSVEDLRTATIAVEEQEKLLKSVDWSAYDGLAINVSGKVIGGCIDDIAARGVHVVTFNADAPDSRRLFYVGHDLRQSGLLAGEIMGKMLGGTGKVVVLGAFSAAPTFIERYGGFCEVIQNEYPDISIFPCAESRADVARARKLITDVLQDIPGIKGIFTTGTSVTMGAIEALRQTNTRGVAVIGFDLTKTIIDALRDNWCTAVMHQDPVAQGYQSVKMLARNILEDWTPPDSRMLHGTQVVFKYNVQDYWRDYSDDVL